MNDPMLPGPREIPLVVDSATHIGPDAVGRVVVCGSHGGIYSAWLAAAHGVRAIILNDASVGRDAAGISGLAWLADLGLAAAAVGHLTARIGDGRDMLECGVLTHVNGPSAGLGLAPGLGVREVASRLRAAPLALRPPAPQAESRHRAFGDWPPAVRVFTLDSVSLVVPSDRGAIVATGSHGGLLGGRPETAAKVDVWAALYNDAGGGKDSAGFSRLPALDGRGIAGVTVAAASARIGDGRATLEQGIVSRVNRSAHRVGVREGQTAREAVAKLARWVAEMG